MPFMDPARARLAALGLATMVALVAAAPPAQAGTSPTDLPVTKYLDKASSTLAKACAAGRHLPEVAL